MKVSLKSLFVVMCTVAAISGCGKKNVTSQISDTTPYDPPFTCSGKYVCSGESYPRGEVTSNGSFWSEAQCLENLKSQVTTVCAGAPAQVVQVISKRKNPTTGSETTVCPRFDRYYDYYATIVAGNYGGWGASINSSASESVSRATKSCRKGASGCTNYVTSKNGCVGFFSNSYNQGVLVQGCTREEVRQKANCPYCQEIKTYCANKLNSR